MAAPTIDTLPTPPNRTEAPAQFNARADALLGALPDFVTQTNAVAAYVEGVGDGLDADVLAAETAATNAGVSETNAETAAAEAETARDEAVAAGAGGSLTPIRYEIDTGSTTAEDPGAGVLRFNNATQSSATAIYLDNTTEDAVDLSAYLGALPQSGFLKLVKATDRTVWRIFAVTSITDSTGYRTFTVSNSAGAGSFTDEDVVLLAFEASSTVSTAPVTTVAGTSYALLAADNGKYLRFTAATAKTVTVRLESEEALPANGEWHIRNIGANDLTIVEDSGVVITEPASGSLVLEPGMTVTLKRIAEDEFDLFGQTVAA